MGGFITRPYRYRKLQTLQDFYHLKRDNNPLREEAFTLACLGKLHPASSSDFSRCGGWLSELLDEIISNNPLDHHSRHDLEHDILIIGLTESGIIPALLMYLESNRKHLNTHLIYSTRRPMAGIAFHESHSHGPNHILSVTDCNFREIWIVEDEITSGNTVFNLIIQLYNHIKIDCVRVFAFADFRNMEQKADFISKTAENNICCSVHTLPFYREEGNSAIEDNSAIPTGQPLILNNIIEPVEWSAQGHFNQAPFNKNSFNKDHFKDFVNNYWHLPAKRPALGVKSGTFLDLESWSIPFEFSCGTILAVGESVDIAACFALANNNISFQQISLSPWKVDNKSIFSRMTFAEKYYLYNYEKLKEPIFIICDPIDMEIEIEVVEKLKAHGIQVKPFLPITDITL